MGNYVLSTGQTLAYNSRTTASQLQERYFSPEVYSKTLKKIFDPNLVMMDCVNRDWEGEITGPNSIVRIRNIGNITITPYTRYDTITYQALEEGITELSITEQDTFAFEMDPLDEKDFDINVMQKYTERVAINLAQRMDTYLLGVGINGASASNTLGTTGSPIALTEDNVTRYLNTAYMKLQKSLALNSGKKPFIVVPPEFELLIRESKSFIPATGGSVASSEFVRNSASIGKICNFDVKTTTNMDPYGTDDETQFQLLFGTSEGITFAEKFDKIERITQRESKFGTAVRGLFYYGANVIYDNCLGVLNCTINLTT